MTNAISVDLEEYFHPSEVQRSVDSSRWAELPSRIEHQTADILEMFDRHGVKATFFILGWVAEQRPELVREIARHGHEIACHSYSHRLVYELTPEEFRADTQRACDVIADACGERPRMYRAPSYSITKDSFWALEILAELGFTHDSSIYPIAHDRYGIPGFDRHAVTIRTASGPICEIPISTAGLGGGRITPVGGGAYLRLLPYRYTSAGIRRLNLVEEKPACIYFHPWEIDPDQPRLGSGIASRLRTYMGLRGMSRKLENLLVDFRFATISRVFPLSLGTAA